MRDIIWNVTYKTLWDNLGISDISLPVCHKTPVLHSTGCEVRDGDQVDLGEWVGHLEVVLVEWQCLECHLM